MKNSVLLGLGRYMIPIPPLIWTRLIARTAQKETTRLASVRSEEHRKVHHLVVKEIPRVGEALAPAFIGQKLNLSIDRVTTILDELEKKRSFLFRNKREHRRRVGGVRGLYVTLEQSATLNAIMQNAIFAFSQRC